MSEFWDNIEKQRQERLAHERATGILPPEPEPEPSPVPKQRVIVNHARRNQYTGSAMTSEQGQEARRRYEAGESSPKIARDYGVSPSIVRGAIRAAGGTLRPRGASLRLESELPADVIQDMAVKYREGTSLAELEREYDATRWQITNGFGKIGQPLRNKSEAARLRYERANRVTPEVAEQQRKEQLVQQFRAKTKARWRFNYLVECEDDHPHGLIVCRCYSCGTFLTAETVIIDRYQPRSMRPVCEECAE